MEVLISIFVLSLGLIGVAALLPVGRFAIMETVKSDRAGTCGRAGLHVVKTCHMLDSRLWSSNTADSSGASFLVDPLGMTAPTGPLGSFGGTQVQRINLLTSTVNGTTWPQPVADQFFRWQDDLSFSPPGPQRPTRIVVSDPDNSGNPTPQYVGDYSWFFTVTPSPGETSLRQTEQGYPVYSKSLYTYTVSVVVCYKRNLTSSGEVTATAAPAGSGGWGSSYAGGDVTLSGFSSGTPFAVKENDWIALCGAVNPSGNVVCRWYRVVAVGDYNPAVGGSQYLSLNGPDCSDWSGKVTAVLPGKEVIGVYTEPMQVDRDPLW